MHWKKRNIFENNNKKKNKEYDAVFCGRSVIKEC